MKETSRHPAAPFAFRVLSPAIGVTDEGEGRVAAVSASIVA